jgi:prepilin-type N-terminal cleavage/methylation domain-containing protein
MRKRNSGGFTLVELLVVIAIIGILIALLLPAVQAAREAARRTQCSNNFKQLGLAMHNYHDSKKCFPTGVTWPGGIYGRPARQNFHYHLLPYHEHGTIYDLFSHDNLPWLILWANANRQATAAEIPNLLCPSDGLGGKTITDTGYSPPQTWPYCNYSGVFNGFQLGDLSIPGRPAPSPSIYATFDANRTTCFRDMTDGTSNTMCMAESLTGPSGYYRGQAYSDQPCGAMVMTELGPNSPLPDRCYPYPTWCQHLPDQNLPSVSGNGSTTDTCASRSRHPGGVQVALGDGSARFISETIDLTIWRALATIRGGESLGPF